VILLLDAHTLLWWLADDPGLAGPARDAIRDPGNDVLVSAASVWEIEIKRALGRLTAPDGVVQAIEASGFDAIPIIASDAELAGRLPPHHRDPFDRMLVAQSRRLDAIVVTRDGSFAPYGVDVLPA
jgi:PIN domain nuclease of toxin-antitoxin system